MTTPSSPIRYYCSSCNQMQLVLPEENLPCSPQKSVNGLIKYTDIHRCDQGILGIVNLSVDANNNIRNMKMVELPSAKNKSIESLLNIPSPAPKMSEFSVCFAPFFDDLRIILRYHSFDLTLKIGSFPKSIQEKPIETISSNLNSVELEFYKSSIVLDANLKEWFGNFVDIIEVLPPAKLGLLVEALLFIHMFRDRSPDFLDINILKMIFVSHEILFEINDISRFNEVVQSLDLPDIHIRSLDAVLKSFKDGTNVTLKDLISEFGDPIFLIYYLLILEKNEVLYIIRPGILDSEVMDTFMLHLMSN